MTQYYWMTLIGASQFTLCVAVRNTSDTEHFATADTSIHGTGTGTFGIETLISDDACNISSSISVKFIEEYFGITLTT
jgi:hypothetical protein